MVNASNFDRSGSANCTSPSKMEAIPTCSTLALICVVLVVGNLFTIVLFVVDKRLNKKSLYLVIKMTVADLMYGVLSVPLFVYFELGMDYYQLWTMKNSDLPLFTSYHIADRLFSAASLHSVTCISCERFYAIYRPFKHRTLTVRHYQIVIFFIWALALLLSRLSLFHDYLGDPDIYIYIISGLVLAFITVACYVAILFKFQKGNVATQHQNRNAQSAYLTKTLLLVSITTLIYWIPLIVVSDLQILNFSVSWRYYVYSVFLNYCNSFINAVVYALKLPEFRERLASSFCVLALVRREQAVNSEYSTSRINQAGSSDTSVTHQQEPFKEILVHKKAMKFQGKSVMETARRK